MILKKTTLKIDMRHSSPEEIAGLLNVLVQLESLLPHGYKLNTRLRCEEVEVKEVEEELVHQL
jgi:hypothetical protein